MVEKENKELENINKILKSLENNFDNKKKEISTFFTIGKTIPKVNASYVDDNFYVYFINKPHYDKKTNDFVSFEFLLKNNEVKTKKSINYLDKNISNNENADNFVEFVIEFNKIFIFIKEPDSHIKINKFLVEMKSIRDELKKYRILREELGNQIAEKINELNINKINLVFPIIKQFDLKKYIFNKYNLKNIKELKNYLTEKEGIIESFVTLDIYSYLDQNKEITTCAGLEDSIINITLDANNNISYKINRQKRNLKFIDNYLKNIVLYENKMITDSTFIVERFDYEIFRSNDINTFIKYIQKDITKINLKDF
jgi:hypothetical protein